jgi:hypothetical protein
MTIITEESEFVGTAIESAVKALAGTEPAPPWQPSETQAHAIERLHRERALLTSPIDRIVFDNQRVAALPGLPVGLWLLAYPEATS